MPPFRIELKIFAFIVASRIFHIPVVQVRPNQMLTQKGYNLLLSTHALPLRHRGNF